MGHPVLTSYTEIDSPIGRLALAATAGGICRLSIGRFLDEIPPHPALSPGDLAQPVGERGIAQLNEYFQGTRRQFDLPLDLSLVTDFQAKVFETLRRIPYGETVSYAWVAGQIGQPKAARAIGQACHANPLPILIPCHRVVGSGGKLVGFAPGVEVKRKLLALEYEFKD